MDRVIGISKAPDDPGERKDWGNQMMRIQIAMWVDDGAKCGQCKKPYTSVDNFLKRHPKKGHGTTWKYFFIDSDCWDDYVKEHPRKK